MIEIQTSTELTVPMVAVCKAGNICLYMPADWDVNEALSFCEFDLVAALHLRFKELFADRDYPRAFQMTNERLAIRPDASVFTSSNFYFERFLET